MDELNAQYAELVFQLNPSDTNLKENAKRFRNQADETSENVYKQTAEKIENQPIKKKQIKQMYHELAKRIHPDFGTTAEDREYRTYLMAEVNAAYESGDEAKLKEISDNWERDEKIFTDGMNKDLNFKIIKIRDQLSKVSAELLELKNSELYQIKLKADKLHEVGRDLLREMAENLDNQLDVVQQKINKLGRKARQDD